MLVFYFFVFVVAIVASNPGDSSSELVNDVSKQFAQCMDDVKNATDLAKSIQEKYEAVTKDLVKCNSQKQDPNVLCAVEIEKARNDQLRALGDGVCTILFQGSVPVPFFNSGYPTAGRR